MSKQLAVSAAFSIFMMAVYVLLGADAAHEPLGRISSSQNQVEVSAPVLPSLNHFVPAFR